MSIEAFTDSATGARRVRRNLGVCLDGRLYLCRRTQGVDLLWTGINLGRALDRDLERLVDKGPLLRPLGRGVWWLCRLVPGNYATEESPYGGQTLYQVLDPADVAAVARQRGHGDGHVRNIGNRNHAVLSLARPAAKPMRPLARAGEAADVTAPKPRLCRPAA